MEPGKLTHSTPNVSCTKDGRIYVLKGSIQCKY